jgi:hypothetical protein
VNPLTKAILKTFATVIVTAPLAFAASYLAAPHLTPPTQQEHT